jgi:hypothetical protein
MERNAEIALARSAAPESISRDAEVLILGRQGYETGVMGKNGFVCIVQRAWTAAYADPEFGSPRLRYPICYKPAAVRSYLPIVFNKTELALAGASKVEFIDRIMAAFNKNELPTPERYGLGRGSARLSAQIVRGRCRPIERVHDFGPYVVG